MDITTIGTTALIAMLLVPVVSLIKRPWWNIEAKHMLGMVAAFIAAVVGAFLNGDIHWGAQMVGYFGTAFATAQSLYTLYFSKTDLNTKLTNVGAGTVTPAPVATPITPATVTEVPATISTDPAP